MFLDTLTFLLFASLYLAWNKNDQREHKTASHECDWLLSQDWKWEGHKDVFWQGIHVKSNP